MSDYGDSDYGDEDVSMYASSQGGESTDRRSRGRARPLPLLPLPLATTLPAAACGQPAASCCRRRRMCAECAPPRAAPPAAPSAGFGSEGEGYEYGSDDGGEASSPVAKGSKARRLGVGVGAAAARLEKGASALEASTLRSNSL